MQTILIIVNIIAFLYAVILHEIAHGVAANHFGDDTAKVAGRFSLNPLVHIDPIGSILVPALLFLSHANFLFGWAKPVPVNPYRLKGGPLAFRAVSLAGIITNFLLAVLSIGILKIAISGFQFGLDNVGVIFFSEFFRINLILAVFNAIPLPGFDGFNFITTFKTPAKLLSKTPLANPMFMLQYGLLISVFLLFLLAPTFSLILNYIFGLFSLIFGL